MLVLRICHLVRVKEEESEKERIERIDRSIERIRVDGFIISLRMYRQYASGFLTR